MKVGRNGAERPRKRGKRSFGISDEKLKCVVNIELIIPGLTASVVSRIVTVGRMAEPELMRGRGAATCPTGCHHPLQCRNG